MYLIGTGAIAEFVARHPDTKPTLDALVARMRAEREAESAIIARSLGPAATIEGDCVTIALASCGVTVRVTCNASAQLLLISSIRKMP